MTTHEPAGPSGPPGLVPSEPRSRIVGGFFRQEGAKGVAIAVVSTIVLIAIIANAIRSSPHWPDVKEAFFNWDEFRESLPEIAWAFRRNVLFFMVAEGFILAWALILAIFRGLPGPVFFPLRLFSVIYTDVFRGIPTVLLVLLLGFGIPSLGLPGVPIDPAFWGVVALVIGYSAYVAEVYRAGIESVHPSQTAAARAIGLGRWQSLRFVIVPQAVRRVIPPLLNDFIGLQKDTALIAFVVAVPEAFKQGQIIISTNFNFTPFLAVALMFLLVTVPLTRFTDWLVSRERKRRQAGASL